MAADKLNMFGFNGNNANNYRRGMWNKRTMKAMLFMLLSLGAGAYAVKTSVGMMNAATEVMTQAR